jgi:hypothetical protein
LRTKLAQMSHCVFRQAVVRGDFHHFVRTMQPVLRRYYATYAPTWRMAVAFVRSIWS